MFVRECFYTYTQRNVAKQTASGSIGVCDQGYRLNENNSDAKTSIEVSLILSQSQRKQR